MRRPARAARSRSSSATACPTRGWSLDYRCPDGGDAHDLRSTLFPDSEGYVRGTKTIVTYDLDLQSGSASLDAKHPSFSTKQSRLEQYWEFFRLGAEHLYTGIDHILFLLALIAGSRRLREVAGGGDDLHDRAFGDVHACRARPGARPRRRSSSR